MEKIAKESGISLTAALEIAIREAARKRGLKWERIAKGSGASLTPALEIAIREAAKRRGVK